MDRVCSFFFPSSSSRDSYLFAVCVIIPRENQRVCADSRSIYDNAPGEDEDDSVDISTLMRQFASARIKTESKV